MSKKVIIEKDLHIAFINGVAFSEEDNISDTIRNIVYLLEELGIETEIIEQ